MENLLKIELIKSILKIELIKILLKIDLTKFTYTSQKFLNIPTEDLINKLLS
jgi:hypothetical protein